jgi:hypothetical protein
MRDASHTRARPGGVSMGDRDLLKPLLERKGQVRGHWRCVRRW